MVSILLIFIRFFRVSIRIADSTVDFFEAALPAIPTLRGVKHTSPSLPNMHTLIARYGQQVQVLTGNDEIYLAALAIGIKENVGQSFLGRVLLRMKEAFDKGDLATARMEQVIFRYFCLILNLLTAVHKVVIRVLMTADSVCSCDLDFEGLQV
jgi:dihydrodipicolinate synthase/N-acetylneuraminate lyase